MTPVPSRDTEEGRAYNDIRQLAKQNGRDSAEYFAFYALEGFLFRLAQSAYARDFVLKGGVLMAAFAGRRPTRDIDFSASGFPNDIKEVEQRVKHIAAQPVEDGLRFDLSTVRGEVIRDEADYQGVRVHLTAHLARAKFLFHVDINFGDPIWPAPQTVLIPRLLGGTFELSGYPPHMVLAEKIVTAIERSIANTRWRDFVDIASLARTISLTDADLYAAFETVANHRQVVLQPLTTVLVGMTDIAQSKWIVWRRKQRLEASTPERFQELTEQCAAFADPVLSRSSIGCEWVPQARQWKLLSGHSD
jgi:hypothetical protein